jgi:hypothetical protein
MFIKCDKCGKEFKTYPSLVKAGRRYCSKKCKGEDMRGIPSWNSGKKCPQISAGCMGREAPNKGKTFKHTETCQCPFCKNHRGEYISPVKGKKLPHLTGPNANHWGNGKTLIDGYVMIYSPEHPNCRKDKYYPEHRLVWEKHNHRILTPEEKIHHIDGTRTNNKIENLMYFPTESDHQRYHAKLRRENKLPPTL